jgi:hypothetical protein
MLTIDRMSLVLPAGLDHRATEITDGIRRRLGALQWPASREIKSIVVSDLAAGPHLTPDAIALHVADAIARQLTHPLGVPARRNAGPV